MQGVIEVGDSPASQQTILTPLAKEDVCAEKRRLSDAVLAAAQVVLALEEEQRALIRNGGTVALLTAWAAPES